MHNAQYADNHNFNAFIGYVVFDEHFPSIVRGCSELEISNHLLVIIFFELSLILIKLVRNK